MKSSAARKFLSAVCAAAALVAQPALGDLFRTPELTAHHIRDGVYWISSDEGVNSGFIVGDDGVVIFDAFRTPSVAEAARELIARVTSKPVDTAIISHGDPDHVGGLPGHPDLTEIIMHENARSVISASIADMENGGWFGVLYEGLADHMPTTTIGESETLVLNGIPVELIYTGPAHTSADLLLYLPEQKIVFAGDLLVNEGDFPVIHIEGSSLGWINAVKTMLALDADIFVPGHGGMETREQIEADLRTVEHRRARIKIMVDNNWSWAEVDRALPEEAGDPRFETFTETVYKELTRGYPIAQPPWANVKPQHK